MKKIMELRRGGVALEEGFVYPRFLRKKSIKSLEDIMIICEEKKNNDDLAKLSGTTKASSINMNEEFGYLFDEEEEEDEDEDDIDNDSRSSIESNSEVSSGTTISFADNAWNFM